MTEKIWLLRRLNLFDGMTDAEVEEISRELRMRSYASRQLLSLDGGDRVYLLKQGRVRLYHLTPDGQEITTAVVVPGQLFGLGAFLGGDGTATYAEVLEEGCVCEAGAQDFLAILARHPLLMARVVMVMAKQIFRLEQTIESMASQPVPRRLATLLLEEMEEGETMESGVLLPPHSQEELARLVGTTRESVSRSLSVWRAEGLITMRGRRIVILDPRRLRREAARAGHPSGPARARRT